MFDSKYKSQIQEKVFREAMELSEAGCKIIGVYCAFTPKELIAAAGAIPVSLCAGSQDPFEAAEKALPRNLCPLIKSSYGHAVMDTCPYFHSTDFLIADATCDGKKKMFELLGRIKPLHLMHLPQTYGTRSSLLHWTAELKQLKTVIENITGHDVSSEDITSQIRTFNRYRRSIARLFELNTGEIPLVYGREIDSIIGAAGYDVDIFQRTKEIENAIACLLKRKDSQAFIDEIKTKPRILLTGCPNTNKKMLNAIEDCQAIVVAMENCGGLKTVWNQVDENEEPIEALARRYLSIACSCMTPNPNRLFLLDRIITQFNIQGVVDLTWDACHTYNIESFQIKEHVSQNHNLPFIQIQTDYSPHDDGQIKTRIDAFIELIYARNTG